MNISDMIEFVNKISSFDFEEVKNEDSIAMSECRDDTVNKCSLQMEMQVVADKVEGV